MKKVAFLALLLGSNLVLSSSVVAGDATAGAQKAAQCAACHGKDGNSVNSDWPKLAGQNEKYLVKQIKDFRLGAKEAGKGRTGAQMAALWGNVSEEDAADISAFFAAQQTQLGGVDEEFLALGKRLYFQGDAERGVPACAACHGATGQGLNAAGYPSVSGQFPEYAAKQLKAFASGTRNNDDNAVMRDIAVRMSDKQIEAVANFMLGLH
ncbi:c-type cytochrome [Kangiella sp. HZ709]|uniref:c-type cytochrome n=1 Tax=Kangiella sp. HZ709 TaxID=2666328 RepID=UPI0012B05BE9|nr:c-type cytochrome [Kangiella sp. HZ709]MRX28055.1 c-type cytochrome [Kangiella sp. HZ709]